MGEASLQAIHRKNEAARQVALRKAREEASLQAIHRKNEAGKRKALSTTSQVPSTQSRDGRLPAQKPSFEESQSPGSIFGIAVALLVVAGLIWKLWMQYMSPTKSGFGW